ncbi:MAG: helix-turn-helix domain-containing protein [Nitrososphaeria archaeon]
MAGVLERLKEMGLSEYESRIYAALLRGGPAKVADLAVRAGVPRTKVYEAVKSLERKGLAELHGRPLLCAAMDPDEVLGDMVEEEERRARRLRRTLEELRRLGKGIGAVEGPEGRYSLVAGTAIVERLRELISGASREVHGILDHWGAELALSAKKELRSAALGDVEIRLVVDGYDEESTEITELAELTRVALHGGGWSAFTFDGRIALLLDSRAGVGMALESPIIVEALGALFNGLWESGMPLERFLDLVRTGMSGAASLLGGEDELYGGILEALLSTLPIHDLGAIADAAYSGFLKLLPEIDGEPAEASMVLWSALLRDSLPRGSVRYDQLTKIMTIEYGSPAKLPPTPWFLAFLGYLRSKGVEPSVVHSSAGQGLSVLQLKFPQRASIM